MPFKLTNLLTVGWCKIIRRTISRHGEIPVYAKAIGNARGTRAPRKLADVQLDRPALFKRVERFFKLHAVTEGIAKLYGVDAGNILVRFDNGANVHTFLVKLGVKIASVVIQHMIAKLKTKYGFVQLHSLYAVLYI